MSAGDGGSEGPRADEIAARRNAKIAIMLCSLLSDNKADEADVRRGLLTMAAEPLIARQLALIIGLDDTLRARFADLLDAAETTVRAAGDAQRSAGRDFASVEACLLAADRLFRAN
jgi:hypothetical protein